MARRGRRTKYTPATVGKLCQALALGATYDLACKYAGISFETFNEWRKAKTEFSEQLEKAEGEAVVGWLAKIERAANAGEWTASAWKLERRYPHLYGRQRVEVEHRGTIQHEHYDLTKLSDGQLSQLEQVLAHATSDARRN